MKFPVPGVLTLEITSADVTALLDDICRHGVAVRDIIYTDHLTVRLKINNSDINAVKNFVGKRGAELKIIKNSGLSWWLQRLTKRPVMILGSAFVVFLLLWIPTRVLFITVEGNVDIPAKHIIERANQCGIFFGASRRDVRSEKMKNSLLEALPSLQWAGINTNGCTAVISVKEKTKSDNSDVRRQVSSIVAVRDGIIESYIVLTGNPLCKTGQFVKRGDVLISGYTDYGVKISATKADGEVFAQTKHDITVFMPTSFDQKGDNINSEKRFSVIIGKKRINFYKGSGILGAGCDKIEKEYRLKLPGGYYLPVTLLITTIENYDGNTLGVSLKMTDSFVYAYAKEYVTLQMISGKVLKDITQIQYHDGVCVLSGKYICSEMIGRVQNEETIGNYGEDNGENR